VHPRARLAAQDDPSGRCAAQINLEAKPAAREGAKGPGVGKVSTRRWLRSAFHESGRRLCGRGRSPPVCTSMPSASASTGSATFPQLGKEAAERAEECFHRKGNLFMPRARGNLPARRGLFFFL